jgi:glycosyltransferase involved in cell wall biosynthesis
MTFISVVAPILNEETLISEFIKRVTVQLNKINSDYEIILIDDGSTDNSWSKIQIAAKEDKKIVGIKLSKNFGHHYAITAGLHNSKGEWVVVMDSDLQDRPEVIPELLDKAQEGFDVVFVSRQQRPESFAYKLGQRLFYTSLRFLSGIDFDSKQANFSIINRKVVEAFKKFPENARFYGSTIKWLGFSRASINAAHGLRFSGRPSYTIKKRITLALDIILSFSDRPLRFAIGLGLLMSAVSVLFSLWIFIGAINWGFSVIGWPSLIVSIFFTGGVILIVLGIIGIYLGRIFREVKARPLYVVSESLNIEKIV